MLLQNFPCLHRNRWPREPNREPVVSNRFYHHLFYLSLSLSFFSILLSRILIEGILSPFSIFPRKQDKLINSNGEALLKKGFQSFVNVSIFPLER